MMDCYNPETDFIKIQILPAMFLFSECRPHEMYELRKRLTGYFVLIHTESRQKHHRMNHHGHFGGKHHDHHKSGHKRTKRIKRSLHDVTITTESRMYFTELQIRGGTEDNSKIIFLISQQKHML